MDPVDPDPDPEHCLKGYFSDPDQLLSGPDFVAKNIGLFWPLLIKVGFFID